MRKSFTIAILILFCIRVHANSFGSILSLKINKVKSTGFSNPLPVILVEFQTVAGLHNSVDINWSTQQEINSSRFEIERSADAVHWEVIGTVSAKGNSLLVSHYYFNDKMPMSGVNYYRLHVLDLDENGGYAIVSQTRMNFLPETKIFPNPATNVLHVEITQASQINLNVRILDVAGTLLNTGRLIAGKGSVVSIPLRGFAPGTYLLELSSTNGLKEIKKFVVMK